jgi:hypothetical protein
MTARVSPDGRFVEFMSSRSLTGYDNRDVVSGEPDQEVFLYDAESARLRCVSCDPTGGRPAGAELLRGSILAALPYALKAKTPWISSNVPTGDEIAGFGASLYQSRTLSDSGRSFFNSADALVPEDINGAEDVYEWEPAGVGSCSTASSGYSLASDGCVALISSGRSPGGAGFLDASSSGNDAFFLTEESLVKKDIDSAMDVYDAHVCGAGWECANELVVPPPCDSSNSCRQSSSLQPEVFGPPPSATFKGEGNVVPITAGVGGAKAKKVVLTRKQKLSRVLAQCRKRRKRNGRVQCERVARKRFGARSVLGGKGRKAGVRVGKRALVSVHSEVGR